MEEKSRSFLSGRIRELANRAYNNGFVTSTEFLSMSEQNEFYKILAAEGIQPGQKRYCGAEYVIFGGYDDAEREIICFLPEYMDRDTFLVSEKADNNIIACIHVTPLNEKFSDDLTHRDYLGSLMNLGIERDQIGDILTGKREAYVYATREIAEVVCKELIRIRHTSVKCELVRAEECNIRPEFKEISGSVASERIDAIIALVYHLSRSEAQRLIESESVFIDGRIAYSGGYDLKSGSRVSVRGHGKFIYDGLAGTTRKGRVYVNIRVFV